MLEQIDLDRALDKQAYKPRLLELQTQLYDMERALLDRRIPLLIVFEGWAGTSKVGMIGQLTRRLDPRGLQVHSITPPRTYETQYPWLYRFWLKTPLYGRVAIFDRSWYREVLADRTRGELPDRDWRARCEDIAVFERQLAADGALILKFWLHIAKKEQRRRFCKLLADPLTAWQVTDEDRWQCRHYKRVRAAVNDLLTRTDTSYAPWSIVPATDRRYMHIAVIETILGRLAAHLGGSAAPAAHESALFDVSGPAYRRELMALQTGAADGYAGAAHPAGADGARAEMDLDVPTYAAPPGILRRIDLSQTLESKTYEHKLAHLQARLHLLGFQVYQQKRPVVLVFEGWDAAGKGGVIKRLTEKIDPRGYVVHAVAAPTGEDRAHHYLYRFWRRLPTRGAIAIFDRSWYGRVLVERVEEFARPDEWQRAYAEINEFERQLAEFGMIVCKFWLHISPEEQLRRFEERQNVPYKAWKLTDEDWRNREKWPQYEQAADEMLLRTSTPLAPWTIVEAEDKHFARIKVLRTVVDRLEDELGKVKF